jgi:hypothetical protein
VFRTLRENGPALLVPLAWGFVALAHAGLVGDRPVLIAHVVMSVLLAAFAVLSWGEMREGVLLAWRRVVVAGLGLTLAGLWGLLGGPRAVLPGVVVGWMLLPAAGFLYTAGRVGRHPGVYRAGAALSVAGALVYVGGLVGPREVTAPAVLVAGLGLVGLGQTAGIVAAVLDY